MFWQPDFFIFFLIKGNHQTQTQPEDLEELPTSHHNPSEVLPNARTKRKIDWLERIKGEKRKVIRLPPFLPPSNSFLCELSHAAPLSFLTDLSHFGIASCSKLPVCRIMKITSFCLHLHALSPWRKLCYFLIICNLHPQATDLIWLLAPKGIMGFNIAPSNLSGQVSGHNGNSLLIFDPLLLLLGWNQGPAYVC